jgi:hypothetical protein
MRYENPSSGRRVVPLRLTDMTQLQNDQKISVHLMITVQNTQKYFKLFQSLTMMWNMERTILNTVFENTVRRVNERLETSGGHFEHYL